MKQQTIYFDFPTSMPRSFIQKMQARFFKRLCVACLCGAGIVLSGAISGYAAFGFLCSIPVWLLAAWAQSKRSPWQWWMNDNAERPQWSWVDKVPAARDIYDRLVREQGGITCEQIGLVEVGAVILSTGEPAHVVVRMPQATP